MRATVERTRACTTSSVSSSSSKTTTSFTLRTPRFRSSPSATISRITIGEREIAFNHAHLSPLDALGNFHFAFARQQRHGAHLAQIHAHRVVGFFERARRQIELNVFAFFELKILFGAELRRVQQIDALAADCRHQVIDVVWRSADVLGQHVVHVAVGQVALLLAGIDQVSDVVFKFVVDGQMIPSLQHDQVSTPGRAPVRSLFRTQQHLDAQTCAFADTDSRSPHQKSGRNSRSEQDVRASGFAWSPASRSSYVGQSGTHPYRDQ